MNIDHYAKSMAVQIGIDKTMGPLSPAGVEAAARRFISEAIDADRAASADSLRAELTRVRSLLRDAFCHVSGNGRRAAAQGQGWESVVLSARELAEQIASELGEELRNAPQEQGEWLSVEWLPRRQYEAMEIDRITITRSNSPFYEGDRFAVRKGRFCLGKDGEWEYEPRPSSRDDEFYDRFRFRSFTEASAAAEKAMAEKAGAST